MSNMSDKSTTPDPPAVLTERRNRVLVITLNRPEAMNAINGPLSHGLWAAVGELNADPGLTAGVLTGAGKGFCSGMDLKAFARGEDIGPMLEYVSKGADKPLIGAIEGFALAGGLELALACDLLVAAEGAKLGIPEVGVGLFAAGAGLFRLPLRVGYAKAMEMAVTGEPITAQEAADRRHAEEIGAKMAASALLYRDSRDRAFPELRRHHGVNDRRLQKEGVRQLHRLSDPSQPRPRLPPPTWTMRRQTCFHCPHPWR